MKPIRTGYTARKIQIIFAAVLFAAAGGLVAGAPASAGVSPNHHGTTYQTTGDSRDGGNQNGDQGQQQGGSGNSGSQNGDQGQQQSGSGNGQNAPDVSQVATVSYAAPFKAPTSFDISFVDSSTNTYYFSDRTNDGVDAVNTLTNKLEGVIGAGDFTGTGATATAAQTAKCGSGTEGPNGSLSLTINGVNQVWAGNGVDATTTTSAVDVFDVTGPGTASAPVAISTGGSCRADELAYDATDHIVAIANDLDSPPYLSFISVNANPAMDKVVGKLTFPSSIDGLEQSMWDPQNDMFYVNVPQVATTSGTWVSNVDEISPTSMTVVHTFALSGCSAGGLQLDPERQWLLVGCSSDAMKGDSVAGVTYPPNPAVTEIISAQDGQIVKTITQVGGEDEIAFNPTDNELYTASSSMTSNGTMTGYATPVLGVISLSGSPRWVENVPTLASSHSVAVDPSSNEVFVPISAYGVAVFAPSQS